MATVIRLSRHGKKGQPFYHIVVADSRFARDARFVEKIGTYNPATHPATIDLKFDTAVSWVRKGARPSDTVRTLLSRKGVMLKAHLLKGVAKGVMTNEQAEAKFNQWLNENDSKSKGAQSSLEANRREAYKKRIAAETAARESRTAKRKEKEAAAAAAAAAEPAPAADAPAADAPAAEPQA